MRRLALAASLLAGCIDFNDAYLACFDSGPCAQAGAGGGSATGGGAMGGGTGGAGGGGGGGAAGDWFDRLWTNASPQGQCTHGFCWEFPFPTGNRLNAVVGDETRAIAAGHSGAIILYDGTSLRAVDLTDHELLSISKDEGGDLFLAGDMAILSASAGAWSVDEDPCSGATCIFFTSWSGQRLSVALGWFGQPNAFTIDDGAASLEAPLPGLGNGIPVAMGGASRWRLFGLLDDRQLISREDAGPWRLEGTAPLDGGAPVGLCPVGASGAAVADVRGHLAVYEDGGWSAGRISTGLDWFGCGTTRPFLGISNNAAAGRGALLDCDRASCVDAGAVLGQLRSAAASGTTRWGVGEGGLFVKSTPQGTARLFPGYGATMNGIAADDAGTLWAVGAGNRLMRKDADGGGWTVDARGTGASVYTGIAMIGPGTGFITIDNGEIARLRPGTGIANLPVVRGGGQTSTAGLNAIVTIGQQVVAVGDQGVVAMRAADGGFVALRDPVAGAGNLNDVFTGGDGVAVACGDFGALLLIQQDGGVSPIDAGNTFALVRGWARSSRDFWVVGGSESWMHLVDGAVAESFRGTSGGPWVAVGGTGNGELWAADDTGHLHHWDGGEWSPSALVLGTNRVNVITSLPQGLFVLGNEGMIMRYRGP